MDMDPDKLRRLWILLQGPITEENHKLIWDMIDDPTTFKDTEVKLDDKGDINITAT